MSVRQPPLFELAPQIVTDESTQGIKYAGSKFKLLPHILTSIKDLPVRTVLDGFSGTTRVSQALAKAGYHVTSNDIAVWSETFATAYLLNQRSPESYRELIEHLNSCPPVDGWFTSVYGGTDHRGSAIQPDGYKRPWQVHNTRKLDGIREEIDRLNLSAVEKAVALTSLILALDKVDNSIGHYVSYLRDWSPRSYCLMELKVPRLWINRMNHEVMRKDIFDAVANRSFDLAYLDPPYGSNNEKMPPSRVRFASYYHVWTTVCLNDQPEVFGAARRRVDTKDEVAASVFEDFRRDCNGNLVAVEAIRRLLSETNAHFIVLSYSSRGIAPAKQLDSVIAESGRLIRTIKVDYKTNVMANMKWTHEWLREVENKNTEFIFVIEKCDR